MARFVLSIGVLTVLTSAKWVEPWYCHDLDCPIFTNPQNLSIDHQTVEIRIYESAMWASTVVANTDFKDAEDTGFQRDFDYIDGDNSAQEKINMTSPVSTYVQPAQGPFCTTNFTVSFYVPYAYQPPNAGPPKPSQADVQLVTLPQLTVGVLSFDGFGEQDVVIAEAATLSKLLSQSGLQYDQENWFYAGYDPPFRITGRHNEVW
eukprot:CAMPEP_0197072184 /NCGR_PEP_ID=MMETSP1384-20130603/209971_1 /TAXON_ID=29189 /ORGANISM="Ammonia sp." /LENGTH=204 /DNA_ID=CAMNT_0042510999 /DNA_START=56 /DNA_END=667 /DNA_ORIENTATION=-